MEGCYNPKVGGFQFMMETWKKEKYIDFEFRIHLPPWLFNMAMGNGP
jgi:hypothetical protein